jgi:amidase
MPTVTADLVELFVESDALGLAERVQKKDVTPTELTETAISLVETLDPKLNAVVIRDFDRARARAGESVPSGPFSGVPYLLKNIGSGCEGLPLTNSLPFRKDYV